MTIVSHHTLSTRVLLHQQSIHYDLQGYGLDVSQRRKLTMRQWDVSLYLRFILLFLWARE